MVGSAKLAGEIAETQLFDSVRRDPLDRQFGCRIYDLTSIASPDIDRPWTLATCLAVLPHYDTAGPT